MTLYVFKFLFVVCLLLSLALLWCLDWFHLRPSSSRGEAKGSTLQRLLKPRSPDDCPACRLTSTSSSGADPSPLPLRPWREVKSRRGTPKRRNTQGFACPNRQCPSSGITDAHIHASFWRWQAWSCRANPDLSRPCLPHHVECSTPHALSRLKTPSHQVAVVLSSLAQGLDLSAAERVLGSRQATITTWLTRAGEQAQTLHEHCFRTLHLPHLQLDELRSRLRSSHQVLWLWLASDPLTKVLPVLELGPRPHNMAPMLIHSLRQMLAAFLPPAFHQ